MARKGLSRPAGRGRGRPVGTDSKKTRARIVRAARQVIVERGWEATTFQAIAQRAGLSRPTLHYYFATRAEIFDCLLVEARAAIADCAVRARREPTLLKQLSAYLEAIHSVVYRDQTIVAFLVTAHLESRRHPELPRDAADALRTFLADLISGAIARGELAEDTDVGHVAAMLHAIFWGMGFYAGFIDRAQDMMVIAKQLDQLFANGLLDGMPVARRRPSAPPAQDTLGDTPRTVGRPP